MQHSHSPCHTPRSCLSSCPTVKEGCCETQSHRFSPSNRAARCCSGRTRAAPTIRRTAICREFRLETNRKWERTFRVILGDYCCYLLFMCCEPEKSSYRCKIKEEEQLSLQYVHNASWIHGFMCVGRGQRGHAILNKGGKGLSFDAPEGLPPFSFSLEQKVRETCKWVRREEGGETTSSVRLFARAGTAVIGAGEHPFSITHLLYFRNPRPPFHVSITSPSLPSNRVEGVSLWVVVVMVVVVTRRSFAHLLFCC